MLIRDTFEAARTTPNHRQQCQASPISELSQKKGFLKVQTLTATPRLGRAGKVIKGNNIKGNDIIRYWLAQQI